MVRREEGMGMPYAWCCNFCKTATFPTSTFAEAALHEVSVLFAEYKIYYLIHHLLPPPPNSYVYAILKSLDHMQRKAKDCRRGVGSSNKRSLSRKKKCCAWAELSMHIDSERQI